MAPRQRLVRKAPLADRIKTYLNPYDFLLWLSEELNGNDWEDFNRQWALPIGAALNIAFVFARANSSSSIDRDDVFGDTSSRLGSGWLTWLATFLSHLLVIFSILNAVYTFQRKRHYRLFEHAVEAPPATPSARRVRVDSSPGDSSPLHFITGAIRSPASLFTRAEATPSAGSDVWEVAVWDPTTFNLSIFCLFSPGHVLLYWLFFPLRPLDPRPSVTVVTVLAIAALFSVHLTMLHRFYDQQTQDRALVNRQVQNEYDTKYVRPAINKPVRDVGIQTPTKSTPQTKSFREVNTYTPTTYVNRGFHINPNPDYSDHLPQQSQMRSTGTPGPTYNLDRSRGVGGTPGDFSSPLKAQHPPSVQTASQHRGTTPSYGGNLGVYTHAQSPVRKIATSRVLDFNGTEGNTPRRRREEYVSSGSGEGQNDRLSHLKRENGRY